MFGKEDFIPPPFRENTTPCIDCGQKPGLCYDGREVDRRTRCMECTLKFAETHRHFRYDWWRMIVHACGYHPCDPNIPDDKKCICGHSYYRHFDGYEDNRAVGCKYCKCNLFIERKPEDPQEEWDNITPFPDHPRVSHSDSADSDSA